MTHWTRDPEKAASNLGKHRISFEHALEVLSDPLILVVADPHPAGDRWHGIGHTRSPPQRLILVVYTEDEAADGLTYGRIISARLADRRERQTYEEMER